MSEKILAAKAGVPDCRPGDILDCRVDLAMTHDATVRVLPPFRQMGGGRVWDPERLVVLVDHWTPAVSEATAKNLKTIGEFAVGQQLSYYYGGAEGVGHQVLADYGHARPGMLVIGTDSHTCTSGAFGAFATGVGTTDMASIYLEGKIWLRVPETIRIDLTGWTKPWVMSKDVFIYLLGRFCTDYAQYKALEFGGQYIRQLSMAGRMTLCNMGVEMGSKAAMVEPDDVTVAFVRKRTELPFQAILPDHDVAYSERHRIDVSALQPQVALPHSPGNAVDVREVEGTPVDQVFLGSCTNGRLEDLEVAAKILAGKRVAGSTRLIVTPASRQVYLKAMERGYIQALVRAGGLVTNPSCGACFGGCGGLLAPGEKCLATTNRNFRGRMGSVEAEVYLASPATAAVTALTGKITSPEGYLC